MNKKTIKIHFFYTTLILIGLLIATLAVRLGDNVQVVNYLGFAATIASLLLAFLAIVYSYIGNSTQGKIIEELEYASEQLKGTSEIVEQKTKELISHVEQIPRLIDSVDGKMMESQKMIMDLQEKDRTPVSETKKLASLNLDDLATQTLTHTSYLGLLAIYTAKLSFESKKGFALHDFCEKNKISYDYLWGQYVLFSCIDLINYNQTENVVTFINLNSKLLSEIERELTERIDSSEYKTNWQEDKKNIEKYFKD